MVSLRRIYWTQSMRKKLHGGFAVHKYIRLEIQTTLVKLFKMFFFILKRGGELIPKTETTGNIL